MIDTPIKKMEENKLDDNLIKSYMDYLNIRIEFLLNRFRKYPDFPGVQTGYNSITGEEFPKEDIHPYSWINGRGACVFSRFADYFPKYHDELMRFAIHTINAMEKHWETNDHHFPFIANPDGTKMDVGYVCPKDYKSYSDLYACAGFLEYGVRANDPKRTQMAQRVFDETIKALNVNHFVTEPDPTPEDRILENPWSVAVDLANELVKQLNDNKYLDEAAKLIIFLLDNYYISDIGAYVEYITQTGEPFLDNGRYLVDPGHAIEFCSFSLEFSRLAEKAKKYPELCNRINDLCPTLILWNIDKGWNKNYPGIYKTFDARTGEPVNATMPWWILPETLLAVSLAYEITGDEKFIEYFKKIHNTYFDVYMNPKINFGPFQNIDGKTGKPINIVPACKFQDPEFHSGKNILTVTDVIKRL
jgi:N-acylglucosamine 2-epimerase